jgi:hypothetical protein
VATVAVIVIELPSRSLLRIESQFGVGPAALDITAGDCENGKHQYQNGKSKTRRNASQAIHDDCGIAY